MEKVFKFEALLENPQPHMDAAFIAFPYDVRKTFGTNGMVKVRATFDGHPYRGVLANMGTKHHVILVRKDVRNAIGKQVGDTVEVTIERDVIERTVEIPEDLGKLFNRNKKLKDFFDSLSYTNRKEYVQWITSAKRINTRQNRVALTIEKLKSGLKNPSDKG